MNQAEKTAFVLELLQSIEADIVQKIATGKIPENWDGYELRQLIQDKTKTLKMHKKRMASYTNDVLIYNL